MRPLANVLVTEMGFDDAREAGEVGDDADFVPAVEHCSHSIGGVEGEFQDEASAGVEQARGFGDQAAIKLQAVVAAVEGDGWLVIANLARQRFGGGHVGRIGDDQVEACGEGGGEIAGDEIHGRI